jgi:hypothetical protein
MHWMGGSDETGAVLRRGVPMDCERSFNLSEFKVKCRQFASLNVDALTRRDSY